MKTLTILTIALLMETISGMLPHAHTTTDDNGVIIHFGELPPNNVLKLFLNHNKRSYVDIKNSSFDLTSILCNPSVSYVRIIRLQDNEHYANYNIDSKKFIRQPIFSCHLDQKNTGHVKVLADNF